MPSRVQRKLGVLILSRVWLIQMTPRPARRTRQVSSTKWALPRSPVARQSCLGPTLAPQASGHRSRYEHIYAGKNRGMALIIHV